MKQLVDRVKASVVIILKTGQNIDVSLNQNSSNTNYITNIEIEESLSTSNQNPVGVVSSNILKMELNSVDRSLFPDNVNSAYYGNMNNSAKIKVILEDEEGLVEFTSFYISSWTNSVTSTNPYKVVIEATDILSIVNKNNVPSDVIVDRISTKQAFINMIEALNRQLQADYQVKYNQADINFDTFPTIEYENIETNNMSDWLNTLSQSTLTNIYISRDGYLKTDYLLDDTINQVVCDLSDKVNITFASLDNQLVNYSGVKTTYITNDILPSNKLTTVSNLLCKPGLNKFEYISLNNKTYRINAVRLITSVDRALELITLQYNKRTATLEINNKLPDQDVTFAVEIYGQTLKENQLTLLKSYNTTNEILQVTNRLVLPVDVESFTDGLLSLVSLKNSSLELQGFFNPRIQLGDIVKVDVLQSVNTEGYYKVIGLKWKITNTLKCTMKLLKIVIANP